MAKNNALMTGTFRIGRAGLLLGVAALMPFKALSQEVVPSEQASSASTLDSINEILVTGTKTKDAENVQDVPLAVTAFNAGTLEAFKIRDISGLSFQAPTVSLDDVGTTRGTANFTIRGLGINSSIPSIDPTVGVFVDGVYLGINGGVVFDLFDLESVEILRGPQGVLFGRNVTGGAVVINTGNPTEDFRGYLERIQNTVHEKSFWFRDAYLFTLLRWGGFAGIDPRSLPRYYACAQELLKAPPIAAALARERISLDTYKG